MNNLCILEAGFINPALVNKYPTYAKLFSDFLVTNSRKWKVSSFKIYNNQFPKNIQDYIHLSLLAVHLGCMKIKLG